MFSRRVALPALAAMILVSGYYYGETARHMISLALVVVKTWMRDSSAAKRAVVRVPNPEPFSVQVVDGSKMGGELSFEAVRELTQDWSRPVVLRNFFSVAKDTCDICSESSALRRLLLESGVSISTVTDQAAGRYSSMQEHLSSICEQDKEIYLFNYPQYTSYNHSLYTKTNELVRSIYEYFGAELPFDETHLYNELLLGNQHETFNFPVRKLAQIYGGSPFHNAPIGNVFLQFCGKKTWYFMSPATDLDTPVEINGMISSIFTITSKNIDKLATSYNMTKIEVGQGDAILNPPYVWHAVAAHQGITLSTTHKFRSELVLPSMLSHPDLYVKQLAQLAVWAGRVHDNNIVKKKAFSVDDALARVKLSSF